jgi:hypothetical protein
MILGDRILETERIKKPSLIVIDPPHHRQPPQRTTSEQANHRSDRSSTTFATKSALNLSAGTSRLCLESKELWTRASASADAPTRPSGGNILMVDGFWPFVFASRGLGLGHLDEVVGVIGRRVGIL